MRFAPNVNVFACFANVRTGMFESDRVCVHVDAEVYDEHSPHSVQLILQVRSSRSILSSTLYHNVKFLLCFCTVLFVHISLNIIVHLPPHV